MNSVIIITLTILGLMGYLNLGGPERLAFEDDFGIKHHNLSTVTQDSGGPQRLALDDANRIRHHNLSGVTQDPGGPQRLAFDDDNKIGRCVFRSGQGLYLCPVFLCSER